MKKQIYQAVFILFFSFLAQFAIATPESGGYEFQITIPGMKSGVCKLIGMVGEQNYLADSAVVDGTGKVVFQRKTPLHGGFYYVLFPDNRNIQILLDTDQHFSLTAQSPDLIATMKVEGSLDNELLYQNLRFETAFQAKLQTFETAIAGTMVNSLERKKLEGERDAYIATRKAHLQSFSDQHPESFFTVFKLSGQNPELTFPKKPNGDLDTLLQVYEYRKAYWDNTSLTDERLLHTPVIANKLKTYINQLTDQRIDSVIKYADIVIEKSRPNREMFKFVVNWIAIKYHKTTIMGGERIFVHLVDTYFTDELAFWSNPEELRKIRKEVKEMRVSMLGMQAQDLHCRNASGGYDDLLSLKAPVIVLYIFSYDCEHCKERTPVMKEVYEKWKSKGLEVYALSVDHDEAKWKTFIQHYGVGAWHNVIDPNYESKYYFKYHVDITPEVYVLNRERKIIAKDLHPNQLEPILEKELK